MRREVETGVNVRMLVNESRGIVDFIVNDEEEVLPNPSTDWLPSHEIGSPSSGWKIAACKKCKHICTRHEGFITYLFRIMLSNVRERHLGHGCYESSRRGLCGGRDSWSECQLTEGIGVAAMPPKESIDEALHEGYHFPRSASENFRETVSISQIEKFGG